MELLSLLFFIPFIFSFHNDLDLSFKPNFLENSNIDCIYDKLYTSDSENVFSSSVICLIRCKFESMSSPSEGGAIVVSLKNKNGEIILIDNCTFYNCYSLSGGAIYIYLQTICTVKIENSIFENNRASNYEGSALYISSDEKNDLILTNCLFEVKLSFDSGKSVYIKNMNYQINNCNFFNNSLILRSPPWNSGGMAIIFINSNGSLLNCIFDGNHAEYELYSSSGGAVYFSNTNGELKNCSFNNNHVYSNSVCAYGGAVNIKGSGNLKFEKCKFENNYSSYVFKSMHTTVRPSNGGAVSTSNGGYFMECLFINNTAYSPDIPTNGGAIYFKDKEGTIKNCFFINNTSYSPSCETFGGGIYSLNAIINCEDSYFYNNSAYVPLNNSYGGTFYIVNGNGKCRNCTFDCNCAKTSLPYFLIAGNEPKSIGGAAYLENTKFEFVDCNFSNNTGFGYSPKYISSGQGGAIYCNKSNIIINNSIFMNNTLYNFGSKFDIECKIKGGACSFINSNVEIFDCIFKNNTATLNVREHSTYFSALIYGGAIYSDISSSFVCSDSTFDSNLVLTPVNHKNEFAGAVCLFDGKLENCVFINNSAYNGADIEFYQIRNCSLFVKNCIFKHDNQCNSLFYLDGNESSSMFSTFTLNKIFLKLTTTTIFDGINKINEISSVDFKFYISMNCVNQRTNFLSDTLKILDETGNEIVSFDSAFQLDCTEFGNETTLITQTSKPTITQSLEPTITQSLEPTITQSLEPTITQSLEPTIAQSPKPTITQSLEPTITQSPKQTITQSLEPTITQSLEPTITQSLEPTITQSLEPTITQSPKPTITQIKQIETQPITQEITQTKQFETTSEQVETKTEHIITITEIIVTEKEPIYTSNELFTSQIEEIKTPTQTEFFYTQSEKIITATHSNVDGSDKVDKLPLSQMIGIICGIVSLIFISCVIIIIYIFVKHNRKGNEQYEDFLFSREYESSENQTINLNQENIDINPNDYNVILL